MRKGLWGLVEVEIGEVGRASGVSGASWSRFLHFAPRDDAGRRRIPSDMVEDAEG